MSALETFEDYVVLKTGFYERVKLFWTRIPPTLEGIMEGNENLHQLDIDFSTQFLKMFTEDPLSHMKTEIALDCGCGIGRVTKHLLLKHFKSVVVVDQEPKFLDALPQYLGEDADRVELIINYRIQTFVPKPKEYDAIWLQWILGCLMDDDCINTLRRMKRSLRQHGVIFVKDNLAKDHNDYIHQDGSVMRLHHHYIHIFHKADLRVIGLRKQILSEQTNPVGLYALM